MNEPRALTVYEKILIPVATVGILGALKLGWNTADTNKEVVINQRYIVNTLDRVVNRLDEVEKAQAEADKERAVMQAKME
jgi:hypothetical protein